MSDPDKRLGSEAAHGVHSMELNESKIVNATDYFSQPFEARAWRAVWIERM